jgi:hypothetical protein
MNESDAKAAFRAMGIASPSRTLIQMWLSAAEAQTYVVPEQHKPPRAENLSPKGEAVSEPDPPAKPVVLASPRGKSLLEPLLREQNAVAEQPKRRPRGRPRVVASWFPAVAKTMADGTTLRMALAVNGLSLRANEMRALYRNRAFQALYQEARRRFLLENWGRSKAPSLRSVLGRLL